MERPEPQPSVERSPEQEAARAQMLATITRKIIDVLGIDEEVALEVVTPETVLGTPEGGESELPVQTIGGVVIIASDSLDHVEFTSEMEEAFDVQIEDEQLGEMSTSVPGVYKNGVRLGALMDVITSLQEAAA